jgi:diguanylate cyclase (GGDEF)-like protein
MNTSAMPLRAGLVAAWMRERLRWRPEKTASAQTWARHMLIVGAVVATPLVLFTAYRYITTTEQRLVEREAIKVAEVIAQHALATRVVYSSAFAQETLRPLPSADDFLNRVGEKSRHLGTESYVYRWLPPRDSKTHLDAFQRWAWVQLERQAHSPPEVQPRWEAVWRLGTWEDRRLLRYVRPVPFSASRCADCRMLLSAPGAEVANAPAENTLGLQGALEILVPIEQVEVFAAVRSRRTQSMVIGLGAVGFMLVSMLAMLAARQQRGLARRYEQLAKVDVLTGLPNRLEIENRMRERLALAQRLDEGLGVMFIDVDDFKNINDSLGHAAGDQILQVLAERMSAVLRDGDLIARYSGDEFVVLLSNISDAAPLASIATKLLDAVAPVVRVMDTDIFVTLSIGVAHFPSDGADAPTLLKHADAAMYRAKDKGRNGFQFFAAEMNAAAFEKLHMSSHLWHALQRNEFLVYYQPKADARNGDVAGFEALVRWNHPEQGILLPGRFIPHAEYSGAIEPLGELVLGAALAQLRAWGPLFTGTMAVNLSMRQLYNPELPAMVRRSLARCGVAPERLELEITESMVSLNPEIAVRTLTELGKLGVSIALDDFGTGQSSLSYLLRFPIRTLKIDRSLTVDVPESANACAIARAIIALARSLNMRVVAEGIEQPGQQGFFQREGCDELQGYLLGAPLPAAEATDLLEKRRAQSPG